MKIEVSNHDFLSALVEIKKNAEPGITGEVAEFGFDNSTSSLSIMFGGAGKVIKAVGSWPKVLKIDRYKAEALCDIPPKDNPLELEIISEKYLKIGKGLVIKLINQPGEESCERIEIPDLLRTLTLEEFGNSGTYQKEFLIFMEDVHAALRALHKYGVNRRRVLDIIGESLGYDDEDGGKKRTAELRECYKAYISKRQINP